MNTRLSLSSANKPNSLRIFQTLTSSNPSESISFVLSTVVTVKKEIGLPLIEVRRVKRGGKERKVPLPLLIAKKADFLLTL